MEKLEANDEIVRRKAVLAQLQESGVDPYGRKFERSGVIAEFVGDNFAENKEVTLAGRVMSYRGHGKTIFADIKDVSGRVQVYFRKGGIADEQFDLLNKVDIGDIIGVSGAMFKTRMGEVTVNAASFSMLSKSLRPLPEKWHGLKDVETRYRQRYVDLIVNDDVKKVFICRSKIIAAIRRFLDEKDFLEVETPMMQSIAGGAQAKPFTTHHEALDMDLYLRIAPELYLKRLLVGDLNKVYEINKNFRNEGISRRHNPEFTMIEIYSAFDDYNDMMSLTENIVAYIQANVPELETLSVKHDIDFTGPWKRLTIMNAICEYTTVSVTKETDLAEIKKIAEGLNVEIAKDATKDEIVLAIFEECVEAKLINPTFIIDYPASLCPLTKLKKDDPLVAERFELFINGQELANAYSELNDPLLQRENFERQVQQKRSADDIKEVDYDYVRALEYGMPPAGGLGIGIDRLIMALTGSQSIRDVILFPQLKKEV